MLMGKLIIKNKCGGDGKVVSWSCIAPGCDHTAKGAPQVSRVFKHSTKCKELKEHDEALWKECLKASSTEALGYKLENLSAAPTREDVASKGATSDYTEIERPEKRIKVQSTLNAAPFKQAGKMRQKEEREKFQNSVDHLVMQLICVRGMVPSIVDSAEWKDLMRTLNPAYTPTSATTFTMKHIPHEANHIREKQVKILQANRNLTLTFDGTQVRRPQSVYTAHATTPRRESYLLGGHEGSGERHTTEWIKGHMQKTMKEIGMELFSGACSDSTNVTKAGRRELASEMILLINLNDCVHHIQNTIGDITRLDEFKPMTKSLKATMNHFSKSTLSTTLLRKERNVAGTDEPVKALQKIGKTRFGTYWLATTSLEPCLSGIRNLTERGEIKFKNAELQSMFKTRANGKLGVFEQDISRYNHIVAPFIRSLWSLEAAHANAADVYVFWLAIGAVLKDLFSPDDSGIPRSLAASVIDIYNRRYSEFFKNDIYFVAFMLDPRYPRKDYLRQVESTASTFTAIVVPGINPLTGNRDSRKEAPMEHIQAYTKFKDYLKGMLKNMIDFAEANPEQPPHPLLVLKTDEGGESDFSELVEKLQEQIASFWKGNYPFSDANMNQGTSNPLDWWERLEKHPMGDVLSMLACKIFSILVNSMPDERTNSAITWLNSPIRGCQDASTVIDMITIKQWYERVKSPESTKVRHRPVVKFRKIEKAALEKLQDKQIASARAGDSSRDSDTIDASTTPALDSDSGDSDDEDELLPAKLLLTPPSSAQTALLPELCIDPCINLDSLALRDLVSPTPLLAETSSTSNATAAEGHARSSQVSGKKRALNWDW